MLRNDFDDDLWVSWWVMNFMIHLKITWEVHDVNWCISVWKHRHNDYVSRKHKHLHRTKRWTKDPWVAYPWAPCNKVLGLSTPRHYETKDHWVVTPQHQDVMKMNEKHAYYDDVVWHVLWWFSWLDIAICISVWIEQSIGISLRLDCIWWFICDVMHRCTRMLILLSLQLECIKRLI
jgi:hypothetical protein